MIVLNLTCTNAHEFEGWFASSEEFERQADTQLVTCPYCNDSAITRLPSGPHVKRTATIEQGEAKEIATALVELAKNSENVGEQFPEEARKIHYREAPARSIRGVASGEQVKALIDEGIPVLPIPGVTKDKVH